ncbi:hypothetical protein AB833_06625 [Chromatiales bacterium (ex Bugula neritina AB1)]|nr:hypothetical protein AB833_06625 [Chromatiales bacterium (ex Bugula neritina AB1)]
MSRETISKIKQHLLCGLLLMIASTHADAQLECNADTEVCIGERSAETPAAAGTAQLQPAKKNAGITQANDTELSTRTYTAEQKALADGITADLKERRLKKPDDNNAFNKIQKLKVLQPYHDYSVNGERYIAKIYISLSRTALKRGDSALAQRYLSTAVELDPQVTGKDELNSEIAKAGSSENQVAGSGDAAGTVEEAGLAVQSAENVVETAPAASETEQVNDPAATATTDAVAPAVEPEDKSLEYIEPVAGQKPQAADSGTVEFFAPVMVAIPAGKFIMGSSSGADDEKPAHEVTISAFSMSRYEITMEQYRVFAAATSRPSPQFEEADSKSPVTNVNWLDAISYTEWLSEKTGRKYRLPSEAEWEYAARAGTTTDFNTGEELKGAANCIGCGSKWDDKRAAPVGNFPPNDFGLYDVHGNVWEWVQDCWTDNYDGRDGSAGAIEEKGCERRVLRGGSWYNEADYARSSYRGNESPDYRDSGVGFRVAHDGL